MQAVVFPSSISHYHIVSAPELLLIFTALHALHATRSSHEKAVRPSVRQSVRLSVKRMICDKTKETRANILIPHERSFTLVL